jgi:hypothetical protein
MLRIMSGSTSDRENLSAVLLQDKSGNYRCLLRVVFNGTLFCSIHERTREVYDAVLLIKVRGKYIMQPVPVHLCFMGLFLGQETA